MNDRVHYSCAYDLFIIPKYISLRIQKINYRWFSLKRAYRQNNSKLSWNIYFGHCFEGYPTLNYFRQYMQKINDGWEIFEFSNITEKKLRNFTISS